MGMAFLTIDDPTRAANDPALQTYLAAAGEEAAACARDELVESVIAPTAREILHYKLRAWTGDGADRQEIPDLQHEVVVLLLARLAELRADPARAPIRNLRSYVAVTAYRACYNHLRRKYPRRHSLKQRLRTAFARHAALACWRDEEARWICGLAGWRNDSARPPLDAPPPEAWAPLAADAAGRPLDELAIALLRRLDRPIELDALVGIVAELQGLRDAPAAEVVDAPPATREDPADELARRARLAALWDEIERLPPAHRAALLLNLRDDRGGSAIDLFLFTGVASFAALAAALELREEELAALWNRLPLEDAEIAARLGLSRQQIINLRSTARRRLARCAR